LITRESITGAILCGGRGSRFAGRDKPLELLDGKPLVAYAHERLAAQVASVVVSCNRNREVYARYADMVVVDAAADRGPLEGMLAAMAAARTDYVFACPGDAPFLSRGIVARLAEALEREGSDVAVPHDGEQRQHLFLLARRALAERIRSFLDDGGRAVHAFVDARSIAVVDMSDARATFVNVNTPGELAALSATRNRNGA